MKDVLPFLFFSLLLCFSCGERDKGEKRRSLNESPTDEFPFPIALEEYDCPEGTVTDLGYRKVWLYNGRSTLAQEVDLRNVSGKGLRSDAIHQAMTAQTMRIHQAKTELKGLRSLLICQPTYSRDSAENAGLAMAYAVQRSHSFLEKLTAKGMRFSLSKIDLLLPETAYDHTELGYTSLVDNAFWQQSSQFIYPLIVVYPHSVRRRQKLKAYFWEQPLIVAHEYGHQVFAAFVHLNDFPYLRSSGIDSKGWTSNYILQGLNEAFADLFSYLVMMDFGQRSRSLQIDYGDSYSGQNRDIRISQMLVSYDWWPVPESMEKRFSEALLQQFLDPRTGREFFFRDVHTLGMVVAHIFWMMLETKFGVPTDKLSFEEQR